MLRRPPRSTRTDTLFPYTTLFRSLLHEIIPVVQHNALTGEWPTPAFLENYFDASRLAMARLLLDQCDAEDVEIDRKRVLDIGCHAGCLLRLMRARYPEASLFGCDISDVKLAMAKRARSEEHTSELQSLMRISYAVFCLKQTKNNIIRNHNIL